MDAMYLQAADDITKFLQSEVPAVLDATLKGMSGAMGGVFATKGILPMLKKVRKTDKERIDGLYSALALGTRRAVINAIQDEHDAGVSKEDMDQHLTKEWWKEFDHHLLKLLSDAKAWNTYAETLTSHDSEEARFLLLNILNDKGVDLGELSEQLSLEIDGFLYWLGPSLIREIEIQAFRESTAYKSVVDVTALSKLSRYLDSHAAKEISPGMLRRQLRSFLENMDKSCRRQLGNPFLHDGTAGQRIQQTAHVRVAIRKNVQHVSGALEAYVPLAARTHDDKVKIVPWEEMLAGDQNLVVLADPGLGKTRLLYQHARQLARTAIEQLEKRAALEQLILPILVRSDQLHSHANSSIEEACVDVLEVAQSQSSAFATWLIEHLKTAENVFLFDALDEIPGNGASLPFGQKFSRWTDNSGSGRAILTSRIAGYMKPQGLEATEVELQPFTHNEVHAYVDAWVLDQQSREKVRKQLKTPSFMGMARIPLLLNFICSVASQPESLPRSRNELYDRMLDELLGDHHRLRERTDTTTQTRLDDADQGELRRILPLIALHFANTPKGWVDRMPAKELGQVVADAEPKISDVIPKCVKSGILTRAGIEELSNRPDYFFLHRTFAEYLVAMAIASQHNGWQTILHKHLWFDQDWVQVLPLIGASMRDPGPYLTQLLSVRPDPRHQGLHMATRVIAELSDEQVSSVQDQLGIVSSRLLELATKGDSESSKSLEAITNRLPDTEVRGILMLMQNSNKKIQRFAIEILMGRDGEDITTVLLKALTGQDIWIRVIVADMLAERGGEDVTAALIKTLTSDHTGPRQAATYALARRDGEDVNTALIKALTHQDSGTRAAATYALSERYGADVTAALIEALTHQDPSTSGTAAEALSWRFGADITAALIKAVTAQDTATWKDATRALVGRDVEGGTAALIKEFTAQDTATRQGFKRVLFVRDVEGAPPR